MQPIKRGDVWWVSFDPSVGGEIQKTRPAVILSNNTANSVLNRVVVVPFTSQTARVYPSEVLVTVGERKVKAMGNQITTMSKQRLVQRMDSLSADDLIAVEDAVLVHLGIRR